MATNAEQSQLKQAQGDQQQTTTPSTGAGSNNAPQSGSRVANYSSGAAPTAAQGSGRFTNLKNYVNANQGAGQQLGSKITSNIDKNVQKTNKEATSAAGNVANAISAEKDRLAQGNQFNQQLQDQNADGASAIYNNEQQRDQFGRLLNNQNVASNLQTQAQTAADQATAGFNNVNQQVQNLGTEQGRFALLQQSVKNPGYTQGQQRLDQLMLQAGDPNQLVQQGRNLQNQINSYGKDLTGRFTDLGGQIGQVGSQAEEISKLLSGTLDTQTNLFNQAQIDEAQRLNSDRAIGNAAIEAYFKGNVGSLTPEQRKWIDSQLVAGKLKDNTQTFNVLNDDGYKKYTSMGNVGLTNKDVVDAAELARYQSLAGLSGKNPYDYTQVGDRGVDTAINSAALATDISKAQKDFMNLINKTYSNSQDNSPFRAGDTTTASASGNALLDFYKNGPSVISSGLLGSNRDPGSSPFTASHTNPNGGVGTNWNDSWGTNIGVGNMGPGTGSKIAGTEDLGFRGYGMNDEAAAAAWQKFYDDLVNAGYQNSLAGNANYKFGHNKK